MKTHSLTRNRFKLGAAAAGLLLFLAGGLWFDSRGDGESSPRGASAAKSSSGGKSVGAKQFDVDPCQYLTAADIEAATGLKNMNPTDKGRSSGTFARVCGYDQGSGKLPTVTVFARPNHLTGIDGKVDESETFVEFARRNYVGTDLPGVDDDAFVTDKSVYVQQGDVTVEVTTLVMRGYLPGNLEGEPLFELGRKAAAKMGAAS